LAVVVAGLVFMFTYRAELPPGQPASAELWRGRTEFGGVSLRIDYATSAYIYPNVFYPIKPARYVLETAAGFSREHSIATGTSLLLKNTQTVSE